MPVLSHTLCPVGLEELRAIQHAWENPIFPTFLSDSIPFQTLSLFVWRFACDLSHHFVSFSPFLLPFSRSSFPWLIFLAECPLCVPVLPQTPIVCVAEKAPGNRAAINSLVRFCLPEYPTGCQLHPFTALQVPPTCSTPTGRTHTYSPLRDPHIPGASTLCLNTSQ